MVALPSRWHAAARGGGGSTAAAGRLRAGRDRGRRGAGQLDDAALAAAARAAGIALRRRASDRAALVRLFALVREAATRALGFRPHDTQVMAAVALWRGAIAEMATGEGKTAVAGLCAAAASLASRAVHVITVNAYLAGRDATTMAPLYQLLGLTVAALAGGMPPQDRRAAYAAAICYGTAKEVVFDHLRDRLALGPDRSAMRLRLADLDGAAPPLLMRGLDFAIVDEADSVLVDAARTPLILSGEQDSQVDEATAAQAQALAGQLVIGRD
jgi:preprotein translocase subunit SecA